MKSKRNNNSREKIDRRQFFIRLGKAGTAVAALGCAGYLFHDPKGPSRFDEHVSLDEVSFNDFAVPAMGGKMAIVNSDDRQAAFQKAIAALGGIGQFIGKGDRVLLKVNAAFASPPMLCATSHPDLVSAVVKICFEAGAAEVRVTDNPINDPDSCFRLSGIEKAAQTSKAVLHKPYDRSFRNYSLPRGKLLRNWPVLHAPFLGIDKVIGIAPVKDHHRSGASMTMKNWYGILGGRRNIFHQDIHGIITELAMMISPTFVVLDGIQSLIANGPTGGSLSDVKATRTLIVSTDQVAADAFGATLLGKTAADLPHIARAEQAGAGVADYRTLNPVILT